MTYEPKSEKVVSKQLSAPFLLTFVLRYVGFSDLDSPAERIKLTFYMACEV